MKEILLKNKLPKIIVILGPTATGKTKLAVELALHFNGEIVSADSRQVYIGMDIGTGKDLNEYEISNLVNQGKTKDQIHKFTNSQITKIPYHLIDVVSPNTDFNLAMYQKMAYTAIDDIIQRGKLPIVCGGTGLYLQAIVDDYQLDSAQGPDKKLRAELDKKCIGELQVLLKSKNPYFYKKLNESDLKNKRRLIRYCEIADPDLALRVPSELGTRSAKYDALIIGIKRDRKEIEDRIYKRLIQRLEKEDMVGEVERLNKEGVSWPRLEAFGLEYKFIARYLQEKINYEQMVEGINIASRQYAKRQMTWFRRWERMGAKVNWLSDERKTASLIEKFLISDI